MLVATRDPLPPPGTHHGASRPTASRSTRFVAAMQIAGSVMAIPVGLGTAYSLYRANFSVETTCQTLRSGIIAMIDKKIDATARRMLVRHDVETFETTCAAVDPDAAAAFRTLLAEPPARATKRAEPPKAEAKAAPRSEAKSEPRSEPKSEPKSEAKAEAKAEPRLDSKAEAKPEPKSDARWLDAVRGALVAHEKGAGAVEPRADEAVVRGAPPRPLAVMPAVAAPAAPPAAPAPAPAAASAPAAAETPVATAPVLPPPTQVSEPAGPAPADAAMARPADPDRPVPPAPIPEPDGAQPTGWLSKVPFVGQVLAK